MGARGPGAFAHSKRRASALGSKSAGPKPWEKKGLTRAGRVIAFIESLKMSRDQWAGKRFRLRKWQKDALRKLFATGRNRKRLVREALLTIGRKNGKSELASALALCFLVGPEAVPRGEVYAAAQDKNLAGRIFENIEAFIQADDDLRSQCNIKRFERSVEVLDDEGRVISYYKTLSADESKGHGLNPVFVVMDELAQWKSRLLYDNIMTGFGARDEPLALVISTKSSDPHSVMSEVTARAAQVEAGAIVDPTFCPIIFEVPDDAPDIWDEAIWPLANPALGDFRSLEEMRQYAAKAKRTPGLEVSFRRLYLNQRVDDSERYIPLPEWMPCAGVVVPEELRGLPCYGGLDLSSIHDLTAFVLWFPTVGKVLAWFWLPAEGLEDKSRLDNVPYVTWRDQGWLSTTPGRTVNKRAVALQIEEIAQTYDVRGIAYDTWQIAEFLTICDDEQLEGLKALMQPWRQGFISMTGPMARLEELVLAREIEHGDNPILTSCVANCAAARDPRDNRKPVKVVQTGRIDGVVSLLMAVGLHSVAPPDDDSTRPFRGMTSGLLKSGLAVASAGSKKRVSVA